MPTTIQIREMYMKINVTVLILAALMMGIAGCDETLQLEWTDTIGGRGAVWSGIQNRGTLTLINPGAATIPQETVSAGDAMSFILTSKLEMDTTKSKLILTTRGKQYNASLTLIEAPFVLPGVRNYRASFTPENDSPSGVYHISAELWDNAGARPHLTLGKINLTVEGDTTPPAITNIGIGANSSPIRVGSVVTLLFNANEPLDTANTQAIFTIAGKQHTQSVTLIPNTEYQYRTTLSVTDAVPDGTLEEVVVIAHDPAGNSGRFTGAANLTVEKVAPPPPDTTPPVITNIAVSADSAPIRVGGVVTLSFIANEPLDTERTQAIFTIAGGQHEQSVTLVPNTEYQYRTTLSVTDAVPDGTLEEVVVIAQDAAGNSGRFTGSTNLTIEKVAPPPPDTTPPVVSNIVVAADSSPIRVGGIVTLLFNANEPLDIANTQAIFTIAGGQHEQSVTLVPNTEYQYRTALNVTDAVPDGTLTEVVVIAQDLAGNKGRFTQSTNLTVEKVAPPPPDTTPPTMTAIIAVSDNADSAQAVAGDTVTLTFTTNEPIVLQQSSLTFVVANGTHGRDIKAVADAVNQYTSQLRVTDAMAVGALRVSITLTDANANTSGAIVRDTTVTIAVDTTIAETQARDKLRAWDEWVVSEILRVLSPPRNTAQAVRGLVANSVFDTLTNEFGFEFEKTVLIDLLNLILQEQPAMINQIKQQGLIIHPLSRNGIVYDYLRIQYAYPNAGREEHLAHFRQLARERRVQISRDGATDLVPLGQEVFWESHRFPETAFFTPIEKTEYDLIGIEKTIVRDLANFPWTTPLRLTRSFLDDLVDFILNDLFYYYRQEQPAQAAAIEQTGIIIYPISRNGLLYEWLLLQYRYPDKTEAERMALFRQVARQGSIVVNKPTALTTLVPPGDAVVLFPTEVSHISPAIRTTEEMLRGYDERVVSIGAGKDNPFFIFQISDSTGHDLDNSFLRLFKVKIEFVFFNLWNTYKAEQPAQAAAIERQGIIIHPISRNGLLYEWLWIHNEHATKTEIARLAIFRQSARSGVIQVNRDGPTDIVPSGGTVYIRPPGENELVNQGLVLP